MKHAIKASIILVVMLICGYGIIYGVLVAISDLPYKWMDFDGNGWVAMSEVWRSADTVVVEKEMEGGKCREYFPAKEMKPIKLDCGGEY